MKKLFFFAAFYGMAIISNAQTVSQIDSLNVQICSDLEKTTMEPDSIKFQRSLERHFGGFFEKHGVPEEQALNAAMDRFYFRLQKDCLWFQKYLLAMEKDNAQEWSISETRPMHKAKKKNCRKLKGNLYYPEPSSGGKTRLVVDDLYWTETFEDGTYSKCKFLWTGDCEFTLEFVESNNHTRMNLSVKGDRYHYGIYDITENGTFLCWCRVKDSDPYQLFKVYADQ